jgi:predicted DNA-binding transcriptional regulator YafY
MFERDKNELRDLGVPLETGRPSRSSTVEGYRINRDAYELPEIDLTREETAAVAVAAAMSATAAACFEPATTVTAPAARTPASATSTFREEIPRIRTSSAFAAITC